MKNKLLLTSALVSAVTLTSVAQAEVKFGINHEQTFAASNIDGTGTGSNRAFGTETNLSASGSVGLSNGLKVGFTANIEQDASIKREYQMTIGNDSADLIFGNDFTQDVNLTAVPKVGEHPGTIAGRALATVYQDSFNVAENGQKDHVALAVKGVAGGNIVAIYAPNPGSTADDAAAITASGTGGSGTSLSYLGKPVENLTVGLVRATSKGANATSTAADKEDKETVYSVGYAMGKFAVGAERRKLNDGASAKDITGTYLGATVNVSDVLSVGYGYTKSQDDTTTSNPDETQKVLSVGYNLGGLGVEISYAMIDNASNSSAATASGNVVQIRTKVAF